MALVLTAKIRWDIDFTCLSGDCDAIVLWMSYIILASLYMSSSLSLSVALYLYLCFYRRLSHCAALLFFLSLFFYSLFHLSHCLCLFLLLFFSSSSMSYNFFKILTSVYQLIPSRFLWSFSFCRSIILLPSLSLSLSLCLTISQLSPHLSLWPFTFLHVPLSFSLSIYQ